MFERFTCWRLGHDLMAVQLRDTITGDAINPHTLVWTCRRCLRTLGTTTTTVLRIDPLRVRLPSERTTHVTN
jgi:hypothetical protein